MNRAERLPRDIALEAVEGVAVSATGLVAYQAGRRLLIVVDEHPLPEIGKFEANLDICILARRGGDDTGLRVMPVQGRSFELRGYLGAFELLFDPSAKPTDKLTADLVLDLSAEPLIRAVVKPPGYMHTLAEKSAVDDALGKLTDLVGTFDKPQYFSYDPDVCAHQRNGVTACTRCIESCPAEAISSLPERVHIDSMLCQGGGVCASVCPSGAIRYAYPSPGTLGGQIRVLLQRFREAGGTAPLLLLHEKRDSHPAVCSNLPNALPLALEELGSAGPEVWLAALAYGARRVLLHDHGEMPSQSRMALDRELRMVREVLAGLNYPAQAIGWLDEGEAADGVTAYMPEITPTRQAAMESKRTMFYMALDHLAEQAENIRSLVELPAGSPFGAAAVDPKRCTLCMACASVCPAHALQDGGNTPVLRFLEANCIQCGLCTRTCPEDAIWITPRIIFDASRRASQTTLHEDTPFCCICCGKPFATRAVIDRMLGRLAGHWMFQDERSRERLKMCEDCRVADVVLDPEAMGEDGMTRQ